MTHNDDNRFSDLPDDAQRAFERAVRYLKREDPECGPLVGIWRDVAKRLWTDKMQYARPEVTGGDRLAASQGARDRVAPCGLVRRVPVAGRREVDGNPALAGEARKVSAALDVV